MLKGLMNKSGFVTGDVLVQAFEVLGKELAKELAKRDEDIAELRRDLDRERRLRLAMPKR